MTNCWNYEREYETIVDICSYRHHCRRDYGLFLYQNRIEFWKAQTCSTFRVVLAEELHERSGIEVYFYMNGKMSLSTDSINLKKEPIKVWMRSDQGERDFLIPYEKHIHNVERSSDIRGMHSYLLHVKPLVADSLNRIWENLLTEMKFPGKTIVHISVADWNLYLFGRFALCGKIR